MTKSLLDVRRGAQEPRVSSHPPYRETSGPEAADLIAETGQEMDPWQRLVLDHGLAERDDGRWACREVGVFVPRQNGKGAIIEAVVLANLFLFGAKRIVWTAHEYKTAAEGFIRLKDLIHASPDMMAKVERIWEGSGEQGVELTTGQRLKFLARSKGSGRGFSGDLIILDEAQYLSDREMRALFSTMSARPNAQIWYFGTPPEDPAAWIYGLKADGEAGKDRLCWMDWGQDPKELGYRADTGLFDLELCGDRDRWYDSNPALGAQRPDGSGISEEFAEDEFSRLQQGFAAERLGAWLPRAEDGAGVIPREVWRAQADRASERPTEIALAVQVNYRRTYTAIAAVGRRADGSLLASIVDYRPGTHWVVERMAELAKRWEPVAIAVQDKGPTGSLLEDMAKAGLKPSENRDEPKRGEIAVPWADDVADAYGMFVDATLQGRLWHLDEAPLNLAVASAETRPLSGATAWDYKGDVDSSPLLAATLALWAYETRAHLVRGQYDPLTNIF